MTVRWRYVSACCEAIEMRCEARSTKARRGVMGLRRVGCIVRGGQAGRGGACALRLATRGGRWAEIPQVAAAIRAPHPAVCASPLAHHCSPTPSPPRVSTGHPIGRGREGRALGPCAVASTNGRRTGARLAQHSVHGWRVGGGDVAGSHQRLGAGRRRARCAVAVSGGGCAGGTGSGGGASCPTPLRGGGSGGHGTDAARGGAGGCHGARLCSCGWPAHVAALRCLLRAAGRWRG